MSETVDEKQERILPRGIEDEMKESYLDYAMSVLVSRALPDARDGLKPVHRRVLYTMHQLGLLHNKPFRKSATIVGNCMARWHPHGDASIYDTLVRMAQDFSLRFPLVKGQGNFGSVDGDSAAAMRYTEAKLAKIAEELLKNIEKNTVDFAPNFDGSAKEPTVLPSMFPNLLVNGSSGIAVGMATNIPPHNFGEVVNATIAQIDNPEIDINELMQHIKGPDFPTGAQILGTEGIKNAYRTGRGIVRVRAKTFFEEYKGHNRIIVSEIPFQVNKATMIEEIADLVRLKKIIGIADLRDESDREGIRVVIDLKKDANKDVVLNQLLKHSKLQSTFGINIIALVNNQPRTLNLKQIIVCFIDHRKNVVTRRTQFELEKATERAHILEGLITALNNIDEVIDGIKKSREVAEAKKFLMDKFSLTEKQAVAILEMRLQKLASLEQEKIKTEHTELLELIKELKEILASEKRILEIIKQELVELKEKYSDGRRTEISAAVEEVINVEDLIKPEDMVVTISHAGYIKRTPVATYRQQHRGGKGVIAATTREEDFVEHLFIANTHSYILFFTDQGVVHWLKVHQIPEAGRQASGRPIVNLLQLEKETINAFVPVKKFDEEHNLIMATKKGTVKKTNLMQYSRPRRGGIIAITLEEDDRLIGVGLTDNTKQIILATRNGLAVRFKEQDVRPTGRSAMGVRGIRLREDDEVIGMVVVEPKKTLLTVTAKGYGKRTPVEDYRLINRGGSGVINIKITDKNGKAVSIKPVTDDTGMIFISKQGIIIRMAAKDISTIGRNTQGVRIMRLGDGDILVAAARVIKND
ncbi:MAG: DNA gyrase subunit A [bacterium]|nr:DNA gyrase subunit A [bacterium]